VPAKRRVDETALFFGTDTGALSTSELALRQLAEDDTMTRTQRRPPAIWIWSGIIGVVVIVVAVMYWAFNLQPADDLPSNARQVPALTGSTWEEAANQLQALTLPATRIDETNDTVAAGEVIRTEPAEGEIVDTGTPIRVFISTGREAVAVPDLVNMTLEQAKTDLEAAGLVAGSETRQNSPTVAGGTVLATDPEAGSSVETGSTVNFIVSSGNVTLPDLTGQSLQAASSYLGSSTLQLTPVPVPDGSCPSQPGSPVVRQSLAPGDVPQKSEVELVYCAG
jgi:beta-lactam-binding protein with PASTA domain